jgi:reactive intermediate/imine deaminase
VKRTVIATSRAPSVPPSVPLVQGLSIGDFIQVAGQVGLDPATGELVAGGIVEQTTRTLQNVEAVLEAAGAAFVDVLMMRVYLRHLSDVPEVNDVYRRIVGEQLPPRTTVGVELPGEFLVEVDALAVLKLRSEKEVQ